ncbi:MAG: carboxyltransferase domain-containing protein [Silicimonas sp.]|nr:carboxyltransferase domain-containing protein [Silicimonas sp.]
MSEPELLPLGPDGVLVRFSGRLSEPANRAALAFRAALERAAPEGVVETATSLTSVYLRFRPDILRRATLEDEMQGLLGDRDWLESDLPEGRRLWRVPASFGGAFGPDLEASAEAAGVSAEVAVDEICGARLRVLALGFAPGQPYLGFLPPHWDIPRQSDVTPEVPRGAVVVAVRQVIPFANAAPTGWRQVGRTAFRCHDPAAEVPLPLRAGDEMQFEAVSASDLQNLLNEGTALGGARSEPLP